MNGVAYAVPFYSGGAVVKLASGVYQAVTAIGLDDTRLFGRPLLAAGHIEDIYGDDAAIVVRDEAARQELRPLAANARAHLGARAGLPTRTPTRGDGSIVPRTHFAPWGMRPRR